MGNEGQIISLTETLMRVEGFLTECDPQTVGEMDEPNRREWRYDSH